MRRRAPSEGGKIGVSAKVSLVSTVKDAAPHIGEFLDSIATQTRAPDEVVIVDGGSTDGTLAIVEEYRRHFACVISEPDRGMYDALAKGFARATGTVLAYLNADDLFEPGALRELHNNCG